MLLVARFLIISLYLIAVYLVFSLLHVLHYVNLFYNTYFAEFDTSNKIFDYIVVGCGSAGAVIAKRLAEDRNITVLVLEAGQHGNLFMDIPFLGLLLQKSPFDWQYSTVPQAKSCLALDNNKSIWPMGKIVGGTGMLNNMIYVRGHEQDFDEWYRNKEGYNYKEDVLPYFKKFEQWTATVEGHLSPVGSVPFTSILPTFVLEGAKQLGYVVNENTENCAEGFGMPKALNRQGARWTPAHLLIAQNQPNVFIKTNSLVDRILFRRRYEARAVLYAASGRRRRAYASKGIILAAGAVGSPAILLRSGVGPKSHLDEVNVRTIADLPVGENLQDHVTTGFDLVVLNRSLGVGLAQMLSPVSAFDYFWRGSGPWTTGGCETLAFLDTAPRGLAAPRPDLQLMVMPVGVTADGGWHLRRLVGIRDSTWRDHFAPTSAHPTLTMLPVLLHPKSRGRLRLRDSRPDTPPLIDPNYLDHVDDVAVLVRGIRLVRQLVDAPAMRSLGARLAAGAFRGCEASAFGSSAYWECYVRHLTLSGYHPVGTCKMGGEGDESVVDFDFAVRGVNNLFVADGSVMPSLTSGNVNGAVLMLAEMASDRLKWREYLNSGRCRLSEIFVKKRRCAVF